MGCCGSSRKAKYNKSINIRTGVRSQPISVKMSSRTFSVKKTCPKCGWPMSSSVRKYDPRTKTAQKIYTCINLKCKHRMEK